MSRIFAYTRVSTDGQVTSNQVMEIQAAGFTIEPHRLIEEHVSGSTAAAQRPGFARLLDKMEPDDVLVVSRIDRLGRSMVDVVGTVELLASRKIRVVCLQLGNCDLTSSSGQMILGVLSAIAQFERSLLVERVQAGLKRAVAQGIRLGRKPSLSAVQRTEALSRLAAGESVSGLAREHGVSRTTIIRIKKSLADA
jgi:putative DNA-invertase from lambdoid prophage Rac